MFKRYTCPLQPCRRLTLKLFIQGHPRSAKVPHVADFKSAYISLIIGWESSDVVRFDLGPLLQGQTRTAKGKSAYNLLIIGPGGLQCEKPIGNHGLGIFRCSQICPWTLPSRSNDGSLAFMSCPAGGYKFVSVLRCARSSYISSFA